jgi:ATP-dependent DNA helicase RecQ
LERGGFLQARRLDHGGVVLDVTSRGRAALEVPARLDELLEPVVSPPAAAVSAPGRDQELEQDEDEALFQKLRAWRLEQARVQQVAPFVIFHDSHLRAIAARRPLTPEALSEVKGVGPRKLERYGAEVVALVSKHLAGDEHAS